MGTRRGGRGERSQARSHPGRLGVLLAKVTHCHTPSRAGQCSSFRCPSNGSGVGLGVEVGA